ncbi:hypothetical protein JHW43_003659 [Diplocarpon mali]|nr:hypothetical protein JHW43_003659 [Diplocarpon mali]
MGTPCSSDSHIHDVPWFSRACVEASIEVSRRTGSLTSGEMALPTARAPLRARAGIWSQPYNECDKYLVKYHTNYASSQPKLHQSNQSEPNMRQRRVRDPVPASVNRNTKLSEGERVRPRGQGAFLRWLLRHRVPSLPPSLPPSPLSSALSALSALSPLSPPSLRYLRSLPPSPPSSALSALSSSLSPPSLRPLSHPLPHPLPHPLMLSTKLRRARFATGEAASLDVVSRVAEDLVKLGAAGSPSRHPRARRRCEKVPKAAGIASRRLRRRGRYIREGGHRVRGTAGVVDCGRARRPGEGRLAVEALRGLVPWGRGLGLRDAPRRREDFAPGSTSAPPAVCEAIAPAQNTARASSTDRTW